MRDDVTKALVELERLSDHVKRLEAECQVKRRVMQLKQYLEIELLSNAMLVLKQLHIGRESTDSDF